LHLKTLPQKNQFYNKIGSISYCYMGRKFLLGGKVRSPEKKDVIRQRLIDNTINHHTMDAIFQEGNQRSERWWKTFFRGLVHGYKRFGRADLLRIKRALRAKKRK